MDVYDLTTRQDRLCVYVQKADLNMSECSEQQWHSWW